MTIGFFEDLSALPLRSLRLCGEWSGVAKKNRRDAKNAEEAQRRIP